MKNQFKIHNHNPLMLLYDMKRYHIWMHKQGHSKSDHHHSFAGCAVLIHLNQSSLNSLQRIDESAVVYGRRVDDFLNEFSVTVGISCGDMDEDLQVLHPVSQCQHLLGGQDIQLHCISDGGKRKR